MKKISKAKVILRAFTEESTLNSEIIDFRRDKCATCPFNSSNSDDLKVLQQLREKLGKPFCTLCGCNIAEKTTQPTEYCAKRDSGEHPEWNSISVETSASTDLNIENLAHDKTSVDLSDSANHFIVDFGVLNKSHYPSGEFVGNFKILLSCEKYPIQSIVSTHAGCSCTTPSFHKVSEGKFEISGSVNIKPDSLKQFSKAITVSYTQRASDTSGVKYRGFVLLLNGRFI
jgi:hypothetical protein